MTGFCFEYCRNENVANVRQGDPSTSQDHNSRLIIVSSKSKITKTQKFKFCFCAVCSTMGFALVAPLSWIVLSLLDGEYLACALIILPYSFGPNQSCQNTANVSTSVLLITNILL